MEEINQILIKKRNPVLDCAKGIGIVFVVMWHCHLLWRSVFDVFYFNLFFFLLAGLMIKPEKLDCFKNWLLYLKNIIMRYAKPYVLFNLLFLCFYNVFVKYQIITDDYRYNSIPHLLNQSEFLHKAINHILVISRSELLCGATWFLKSLFWGLLTYSIIMFIFNLVSNYKIFNWLGKYKKIITYCIITIIGAILVHYTNNRNVFFFFQTLTCIFIGDLLKPILNKLKLNYLHLLISIVLIVTARFVPLNTLTIIILSITCFIFVYQISEIFQRVSKPLFETFIFLGQNTIPILAFHFISFKIVTYTYIHTYNLGMNAIGTWPIMFNTDGSEISTWWKVAYLVVGIIVPLFIMQIYRITRTHIGIILDKSKGSSW